jgi:hypothetical protein
MKTCGAIEYGRGNYYNCAVYPYGNDNTGVPGAMTCAMHVSNGPVVRAQSFNHGGVCYLRVKGTTVKTTTKTTTSVTQTTTEHPKFTKLEESIAALEASINKGDQSNADVLKEEITTIKESLQLLTDQVKELGDVQAANKKQQDERSDQIAADLAQASVAHTNLQDTMQEAFDKQAEDRQLIADDLKSLNEQLEAALEAPTVPAPDRTNSCSGTCAPEVSGDAEKLKLTALDGKVVFETAECKETDLCELSRNVKALLTKYGL